jgi:hypothetical protein
MVDQNADMVQSKAVLDPLLGDLLEKERKSYPHIF